MPKRPYLHARAARKREGAHLAFPPHTVSTCSLDRCLHILLDGERQARLFAVAEERGVSVATVVREAIDRALPASGLRRRAAASRILAAEPMAVPDPTDLSRELADLRCRHA
jgi:hypothetical protein